MVKGIDVDNYDPTDLTELIKEHDAWFVIVRGYLDGERPPKYIANLQVESVRKNNAIALMYHWAYTEHEPANTVRQVDETMTNLMIPGPLIIDLEEYEGKGPGREWFRKCVEAARAIGRRLCVYSRTNYLEDNVGDLGEWPDVVYWLADHRGLKFEEIPLPKGITREQVVAYQYGVKNPIDLNWIRSDILG